MDRRSTLLNLVAALPLAAGLLRPAWAGGFVDPAWSLEGGWLVSLGDGSRDRFLLLSGVRKDGDRLLADQAIYGYLDGKGKPARDWQAVLVGDTLQVQFLTPADSRVSVSLQVDQEAAEGHLENAHGKAKPVRMTRVSEEELAELRASGQAAKRMPVLRHDSSIVLLYVGARDCIFCMGYELDYFGRKNLMAEKLPEFSDISYVQVKVPSHRGVNLNGELPAALAPLAQPGPNGKKPVLSPHGTPYFALVVDQQVVAHVHGVSSFETHVIPLIQQAVQRRRQAA
ncbi:MAG: hypothetical protein QM586_06855 [Xenophilus sp.]